MTARWTHVPAESALPVISAEPASRMSTPKSYSWGGVFADAKRYPPCEKLNALLTKYCLLPPSGGNATTLVHSVSVSGPVSAGKVLTLTQPVELDGSTRIAAPASHLPVVQLG